MDPLVEETGNRKRKYAAEKVKAKRKKHLSATTENSDKERLEKLVFGDPSFMLRNMGFGDPDSGVEDDGTHDSDTFSDTLASPPRVPAWEDENDIQPFNNDETIRVYGRQDVTNPGDYEKFLRRKYQSVYGEPSWARLDKPTDPNQDEDDVELIRSCGNMLAKSSYLPKTNLNIKRLPSINTETRNEGPVIKAVQFHPTSSVALVAGLSGCASIFQVDGQSNHKLASVRFDRFPIRCARFSTDGSEFIVGSQNHSLFHVYDMMQGTSLTVHTHHNIGQTNMRKFEVSPDGKLIAVAGRFGQIHLLSAKSKEWIGTLTMNGNVEAIAFDPEGKCLYSHGELGEIHMWDVNRRCLVGRFMDDGCLVGTSLDISPCGSYLAAGSSSGVVNLYDRKVVITRGERSPSPLKTVMNLVTSVSQVVFNHSSQLLAIASNEKDNALKMLHLPSMTVYQNFPSLNTQLGRVQTLAFSPSSGYFSCGNNKNSAFLYRLRHFGNY